jgi:hypothetical protein
MLFTVNMKTGNIRAVKPMKTIFWLFVVAAIVAIGFISMRHSSTESIFQTNSGETRKADAYHVVAYRNRKYIIEHRDHRLTVKCERAVTWLDGPDHDPRPMTDPGECMYVKVGEYIGEDLMLEVGQKLEYLPWRGLNTVQTADIMTITNDDAQEKTQRAEQAQQAQPSPPVAAQQPTQQQTTKTARQYFTEMRDANVFNRYPDKYVCFRDDNLPSFVVVIASEDLVDRATRNDDKESAKAFTNAGVGLVVHTYYQGVASDDGIFYRKIKSGEYHYILDSPPHEHIPVAFNINWKTGRYLFKVYAPGSSKTLPVEEISGKCELIHPGDTPSVVNDR